MKTRYSFGGDEHVFVEIDEEMSLDAFFKSLSMTNAVRDSRIKGVTEICPANASLQIRFDPDVISPDDDEPEWDGSPGYDAWFVATKTKPNDAGYAALNAAEEARNPGRHPYPELGAGWDFDDDEEMRKRLPRLSALFADGEE